MNAETRQELFEYLSGELGVLALESNLDDIENIINPKVYPYYLTDDTEEELLPSINKSTKNLSKIEDKDKWLDEVRGKDENKTSTIKIFVDDVRVPQDCVSYMHKRIGKLNPIYMEEWKVVKTYDEFVNLVNSSIESGDVITHVSFDHDLADEHYTPEEYWSDFYKSKEYQEKQQYKEKTGFDCAKWFKEFYENNNTPLPTIFVHSMNPVGTENILNLFKN